MSGFLSGDTLRTRENNNWHDGDRAHVSRAAGLVALSADQVTVAIDEAFLEIEALSRSFLDAAMHANTLFADDEKTASGSNPHPLQEAVRDASIRLQFADRLQQRLSNVAQNLRGFAALVRSVELPIADAEWALFLKQIRATYTMEDERQMFDRIFPNIVGYDEARTHDD